MRVECYIDIFDYVNLEKPDCKITHELGYYVCGKTLLHSVFICAENIFWKDVHYHCVYLGEVGFGRCFHFYIIHFCIICTFFNEPVLFLQLQLNLNR